MSKTKIVENGFFNCKLVLKDGEDLSISVRPDGFVNATQLCKAGKKKFNDWKKLHSTQRLAQSLESSTSKTVSQLIDVNKGKGSKFEQGSWIHPDLALQLAQWISPHFGLQVDKFINDVKIEKQLQISNLDLGNGFIIENRLEDGYINVTSLCKVGKMQFNDWNRLSKTRTFLQVLSTSTGIPADLLIKMNIGGLNEDRKTWVHPQVAINIAQWISPEFDVKVSAWIYELVLTGKVELGKEKTNEELLKIQQDFKQLSDEHKTLITDHKMLQKNHNTILKKRNRTEFDCGNVIYIISHPAFNLCYNATYYKFGKTSQRKDETSACFKHRLTNYNTCAPVDYIVHYLLYVEDNDIIEKNLKLKYIKNLDPSNKEWIKDITLENIIDFLRKLCRLLDLTFKEIIFDSSNKIEDQEEIDQEDINQEENEQEEIQQEENEQEEINQEDINQHVQSRICNKCSKKKEIDMFKKHGRGYSLSCLECVKPYQRPRGNCIECNSMLFNTHAKRCVACANKNTRIVDRPSYEQLKRDLESMSYVACGRKYGVSDNSIRKWIRFYQGKPTKPVFKV